MFATFAAALTLIVFVVPGYVWRTVEGQFVYLDRRLEWEKFALGLLARSTAVYAIFAAGLYRAWRDNWLDNHPWRSTFIAITIVGILPVFFGAICGMARQRQVGTSIIRWFGLRTFEQHQIPTAWDYLFSTITPRWALGYRNPQERLKGVRISRPLFGFLIGCRVAGHLHLSDTESVGRWKFRRRTKQCRCVH